MLLCYVALALQLDPGEGCVDSFDLYLGVCGFQELAPESPTASIFTYMERIHLYIAETTRQVCKLLCVDEYNLSCSGFIYFPHNRTCLLTSFTGNSAYACHDPWLTEYYKRRRCPRELSNFKLQDSCPVFR